MPAREPSARCNCRPAHLGTANPVQAGAQNQHPLPYEAGPFGCSLIGSWRRWEPAIMWCSHASGTPEKPGMDLSYHADTNKVLANSTERLHRLRDGKGGVKTMDGVDAIGQPVASGAGATAGGGSPHLDRDDLSRFEGEGGREVPEPAAAEPQEPIAAAQSGAAKKCETNHREHQS